MLSYREEKSLDKLLRQRASSILLNHSHEMQQLLHGIPKNVKYFWSSTDDTWDRFLSDDIRKCMIARNMGKGFY